MHKITLLPSQNLPQYKQFKGVNLSTAVDNFTGSSHWPPLPKISKTTRFWCLDTLAATIVLRVGVLVADQYPFWSHFFFLLDFWHGMFAAIGKPPNRPAGLSSFRAMCDSPASCTFTWRYELRDPQRGLNERISDPPYSRRLLPSQHLLTKLRGDVPATHTRPSVSQDWLYLL